MTPHISPPAYRRGRVPPWRMDKFSAVRRLRRRLLGWSKNAILPVPPAFGAFFGVIPSKFCRYLFLHKTSPWAIVRCCFQIVCVAVLIQYRLVSDGWTDEQIDRWQQIPRQHSIAWVIKLSYRRGTARRAMLVNSCYVWRGMGVRNVSNSKRDLRCHLRALAMVPFDRPHTISY